MKSILLSVLMVAICLSPMTGLCAGEIENGFLITPGVGVGPIRLNMTDEKLDDLLGEGSGEEALGTAYRWWPEKKGTSFPYAHYFSTLSVSSARGDTHVLKVIRVDSPKFKTAEGISIESSIEQIRKVFPKLELASSDTIPQGVIDTYDDDALGIEFEIVTSAGKHLKSCRAIIVHSPGFGVRRMPASYMAGY